MACREVALLKVNVERAEMDVLKGIRQQHWPLIKQVGMQYQHMRHTAAAAAAPAAAAAAATANMHHAINVCFDGCKLPVTLC